MLRVQASVVIRAQRFDEWRCHMVVLNEGWEVAAVVTRPAQPNAWWRIHGASNLRERTIVVNIGVSSRITTYDA